MIKRGMQEVFQLGATDGEDSKTKDTELEVNLSAGVE